ncbi:MAG: hypothetical protein ABFC62_05405 [Clostridiaceae bacterium]|nr:hypothetical protein [Eubacteriales bacterium]
MSRQTAGEPPYVNASAVEWLGQKLNGDVEQQKLSGTEIALLNDLACRLELIKPFFHTDELEKRDFTFILYNYYQQAEEKELPTPPDGMGDPMGYGTSLYLSSEKATALLCDILGAGIPDATVDYADEGYGDTICKDGVYYIYWGDLEHWPFSLGAYRYLGEDIFYLSFDVDDTHMAGPENEKVGIIEDYCRLLVERSDSEWGFTVLSKLKERDYSILPDDFPLPR